MGVIWYYCKQENWEKAIPLFFYIRIKFQRIDFIFRFGYGDDFGCGCGYVEKTREEAEKCGLEKLKEFIQFCKKKKNFVTNLDSASVSTRRSTVCLSALCSHSFFLFAAKSEVICHSLNHSLSQSRVFNLFKPKTQQYNSLRIVFLLQLSYKYRLLNKCFSIILQAFL